jgi:hypothetical protein
MRNEERILYMKAANPQNHEVSPERGASRAECKSMDPHRIAELEKENLRLQGLVAELLIKNQKLRAAPANDFDARVPRHSASGRAG